jgi:hypothetical protein
MNTDATIVVTKEENVVSNKVIDTDFIAPCTHEEADTPMFLHAKHAAIGGSKSINIVSSVKMRQNIRNAIIWTLFTGKKVKTRIIYFIGTAGPIVHDDSKFIEYTNFTLCQIVTWRT